jgi:hypothetical protein
MKWIYDDGGREKAGYQGKAGDCACRAIAIVTGLPYQEVYDEINHYGENYERTGKRKRGKSNARTGVYKSCVKNIMERYGYVWHPTMLIGQGCKVHLKKDELPMGRILCNVSKHYVAVVDGVIYDTHDPSRNGNRCVYGYYMKRGE